MRGFIAVLLISVLACGCEDQDQKKKDLLTKAGVPDGSAASQAAPDVKSAAPLATAAAPAAKQIRECPPPGKDVTIDDPVMEEDIRKRLAKPKDKDPTLTGADLARLESLNLAKKASVDELDPCIFPRLTGLKHLYLGRGQLRDLSPISSLTHLESLIAPTNEVEDLKPLEKLTLLDRLDLSKTHVKDLTPLEKLVNLTEIQLDEVPVSDISVFAKLKKLQKLSLRNTYVKDVSPLKDLKDLKSVTFKGSPVENIDTLAPLKARGAKIVLN